MAVILALIFVITVAVVCYRIMKWHPAACAVAGIVALLYVPIAVSLIQSRF